MFLRGRGRCAFQSGHSLELARALTVSLGLQFAVEVAEFGFEVSFVGRRCSSVGSLGTWKTKRRFAVLETRNDATNRLYRLTCVAVSAKH